MAATLAPIVLNRCKEPEKIHEHYIGTKIIGYEPDISILKPKCLHLTYAEALRCY